MPADKILRRLFAAAAVGAAGVVYARVRRPRTPAAAVTYGEAEAAAAMQPDGREAGEGHSPRLVADDDRRGGGPSGGPHQESREPPRLDPDAPPAAPNEARPSPAHPYKDQGDPLDSQRRP